LRHELAASAEEMGQVLTRAAFSPNIKERRDHSCAVLDAEARLVAQAEHIPVHLGSMPEAVRGTLDELGPLGPGEVALGNDPRAGGTHLPDLTMVTAVFHEDERVGYVAARAHHADVGGASPASMPAHAASLQEEGFVVPPVRVVEDGEWVADVRELLLANTRTPVERAGDLAAQRGALDVGRRRLRALADRHGADRLAADMQAILDHTEARTRAGIRQAPEGAWRAEAALETVDGEAQLQVEARVGEDEVAFDYAGTDPALGSNLNAPYPVTLAGVVYAVRVVVGPSIPSNAGMLRALDVETPAGSIVDPPPGAPVAGGNVETSQRNVDLLFDALAKAFPDAVPAHSQGTMNNVTLGGTEQGRAFAYYETLGGGEGAPPRRAGASGIHTHMTNTRNTPVETLEHQLPLRVRAQRLRYGSGGEGAHRGGDGLRRVLEALVDDVEVNVLSNRRRRAPQGRQGGEPGASGRNAVERADGEIDQLGPIAEAELAAGDRLIVETPAGGGYGSASADGESRR
jgi:N-methylhydantoinase B